MTEVATNSAAPLISEGLARLKEQLIKLADSSRNRLVIPGLLDDLILRIDQIQQMEQKEDQVDAIRELRVKISETTDPVKVESGSGEERGGESRADAPRATIVMRIPDGIAGWDERQSVPDIPTLDPMDDQRGSCATFDFPRGALGVPHMSKQKILDLLSQGGKVDKQLFEAAFLNLCRAHGISTANVGDALGLNRSVISRFRRGSSAHTRLILSWMYKAAQALPDDAS